MRKILFMAVISLLLVTMYSSKVSVAASSSNMQAVWISTVFNIDFPDTKNNITAQKKSIAKS